jgi:hypothetical protein
LRNSRRLDPQKLAIAKTEFKKLESAGIIRHSNSPMGFFTFAHGTQKIPDHGGLVVITAVFT